VRYCTRGLPQEVSLTASPDKIDVHGYLEDRDDLGDLQDVIGVVSALLDQGGTSVYDSYARRRFTAEAWRASFIERDGLVVGDHVAIVELDDETYTCGLLKFGRPDIVIRGVAPTRLEAARALIARLAEFEVDGGVLDAPGEIRLDGIPSGLRARPGERPTFECEVTHGCVEIAGFK
jgi:hypothetical protein